ncbi:sensor histidine kinase [Nocardia wallacei]|uniref:sensor histidine kinase n=1 Tax=Nocardia wallacei TaxID=480035 RepID=UPI002454272F|nr:ATP-binding protein [Nocardia wallacei]
MRRIRWSGPLPAAARAEGRARRAVGVAAGVGTVAWVVTHRSTIAEQAELVSSWWTPTVVALLTMSGTAVVAAAVVLRGRATGIAAAAMAVAVTASIAALFPAGRYGCFGPTGTWLPPLVATAAVAGVLAWPRGWPVNLAVSGVVAVAADFYVSGGQSIHSVAESLTRTWVMQSFFACVAAGIVRAAAQLDAATTAAVRRAAVAAAAEATDRERSRFAGLIHDNVLATLLDAARGTDPAALHRSAHRTLRQLDDSTHHLDDDQVPAPTAAEIWCATIAEAGPGITADTRIEEQSRARPLPREVVTAIDAALGEAARNSLRHGAVGRDSVRRRVRVDFDARGVNVRIDDDGVGFDPRRVPADRLGIRQSIVERMRRLPGGDAVVESHPGSGTTVVLRWARAEPADAHPPTLLSLRGATGIALLVAVELAVVMLMVGYLTGGAGPAAAVASYGLVGVAGAAVLIPRRDPLPWPSAALIVATGPLAVLATRVVVPDHPVHHGSWILMAYSYVLALLGIRGRVGAAWAGLGAAAVAFATAGAGWSAAIDGSAVTAGTVSAVTGFALYMRPTLRSFHHARAEVARNAGAEARTAAHDGERRRQLAYLDRTARPMLELLAAGRPLDDAEQHECALLEAQLRDRLRAPGFATSAMARAARRARQRGVTVTLLDDGGLTSATDAARAQVLATAVAALEETSAGRITVRALPPGRPLLATIVVTSEPPRRIEIAPDGSVVPTPETSALA